jgi:hypothetical protein
MAVVGCAEPMGDIEERGRGEKPPKRGAGLTDKSAWFPQEESKVVQ